MVCAPPGHGVRGGSGVPARPRAIDGGHRGPASRPARDFARECPRPHCCSRPGPHSRAPARPRGGRSRRRDSHRARSPPVDGRLLLPQGWGAHTAVLVESDNFLHDREPYRLELVDAVHRLVSARSTVRSHAFAGTTVINAELNRSARRDAVRFTYW